MNGIPIIGWAIRFAWNVSLAVPFWLDWTVLDVGRTYFGFVPEQWQSIPFWDCVWLFMCVAIIRQVATPKFASVDNSNSVKGA